MITFICLFFPAVFSLFVYEKLGRRELDKKGWLYLYATDVLFINLGCFFVKSVLTGSGEVPIYDLYTDMVPSWALNYLTMALPLAVAFAVFQVFFSKNVDIHVEENADETEN